ncbi:MAG TPA: DUF456 domain-containing protein [Longimicrobiales bacterium]
MNWLLILIMFGALFTIPLGLPGLWIMIGAIATGALMREIGAVIVIVTLAIALVAEAIEFFIVKRLTAQYGGTRKAFWGAIVGGIVGVFVGVPIPVVGSIVAGTIGSFLGAALVTFAETRELRKAHRVGWGAVIGRALSAVTKVAAGLVILVLGAAALLR